MSESRRGMIAKALLEMLLVGVGVFLGLLAEQWRSNQQHQEQARASLQRFKREVETNLAAESVQAYHATTRQAIIGYLDPKLRATTNLKLDGIRPVNFEHTAWDLAIATQSLADIDPAIAFELTGIYGQQQQAMGLSSALSQAMYVRPPSENLIPFLHSVRVYYDDMILQEPALIKMYRHLLPIIDRALKD